ncbi:DUF58 domain-containing protein [Paenibacillus thalictri]|uniref:DUF58 domain-containing protein n=1 Tax=Paenibacillus thalictri TaxID=2527873 RepID=A0A4Q9DNC6_9BACL|nr:DUF58 domain-containing protein [Paenibacillus thalictri]TBL75364.1 DUF58 domain-containing protein [Paenibacillus thalictri]
MRGYAIRKAMQPHRLTLKVWAVAGSFFGSLCFVLFQGGKLALMLFVIVSILSIYLLLGKWSGIRKTAGSRQLMNAEHETTIEAGSSLNVSMHLQIPGIWPIPYVFVKERLFHKNNTEYTYEVTLVPDWKRRGIFEYKTHPLRRGFYTFGKTECVTEDIFGLFEHTGYIELPQQVAVLPQIVPIREWHQFHQMMKGTNHHSTTTRAVRETTQINGVREYIYGDRLSRIHWNATAKTGTWKSKEFERESLPKTFVVLDRHSQGYTEDEQFELAVSVCASLFHYGASRSFALGLVSGGAASQFFEPKHGQQHLKAVTQHLIGVEADGTYPLRRILKEYVQNVAPGSFVTVISPEHGESMLAVLHWLKQLQLNPCHIFVSADPQRKEHWLKSLKSAGFVGYAVSSLAELPVMLGGRS